MEALTKARQTVKEAETRLVAKGIYVIQQEDAAEAKEFVDCLRQKMKKSYLEKKERREQFFKKLRKIGKVTAIAATALAVLGVPVYATAHYWNTRDEALAALAKYDKPVKITDPQEREWVISHLDEIFEEHANDDRSDDAARRYLKGLESQGYTIHEGANILNIVGSNFDYGSVSGLERDALNYLDFLAKNKINVQKGECFLNLAKTLPEHDELLEKVIIFFNEGYCK